MKLNIYLNFEGNAEEAFNFYKSVFGGQFSSLVRFKDMPMQGAKLTDTEQNKLMHVALPVGTGDLLMASDVVGSMGQKPVAGNNCSIMVSPDSKAEADRIFKGLSAGGTVEMPMAEQIWGDYYGSFKDKFGIYWMVDLANPSRTGG